MLNYNNIDLGDQNQGRKNRIHLVSNQSKEPLCDFDDFVTSNPEIDIMIDDPKTILKGIVSLLGVTSKDGFESSDLLDTTIPRLCEIVASDEFDMQLKNNAIELIKSMCKAEPATTRKFFQAYTKCGDENVRFYEYLLKILKTQELYLSPVIKILSLFINWTNAAYRIIVIDNGYLDILIKLLTNNKLILQDKHGVLNGILNILKSRFFNEYDKLLDFVKLVSDFILNLDEYNEFILVKSYKIIALAFSKIPENKDYKIGFDIFPLFKKSFYLLRDKDIGIKTKINITYFICNLLIHFENFVDFLITSNLLEIFNQLIKQNKTDELVINCLKTCYNCTYFSIKTNIKIIKSEFIENVYNCLFSNNDQILIEALAIFQRLLNLEALDLPNIIEIFNHFPMFIDAISEIIRTKNIEDVLIYSLSILANSILLLNNAQESLNIVSILYEKQDFISKIHQTCCSNNLKISKLSNLLFKLINN